MDTIPATELRRRMKLFFLLLPVSITAIIVVWLCRGNPSASDGNDMAEGCVSETEFDIELFGITNGISRDFRKDDKFDSHIIPCLNETREKVKNMTNEILRLAVARHVANELLSLNLTNGNYQTRDWKIGASVSGITYVDETLLYANASEMERCKFIFDALQHYKEGALATLDELAKQMVQARCKDGTTAKNPDGTPLLYYPGAIKGTCAKRIQLSMQHEPNTLNKSEFRRLYTKLSEEGQEYFKNRFLEVFGIDYIPDEPGKKAYLYGEKGTRWDGKGLKWCIYDDKGNRHDVGKTGLP